MAAFDEDLCMRSSYELLLGKKTMDELLKEHGRLYLMFNPTMPFAPVVYSELIDYFVSIDEFDKCVELRDAISQESSQA